MLKVSHITMTNKQRHLLTDVSLYYLHMGFVPLRLRKKRNRKGHQLSFLAGMKQADAGFFTV